MIPVIIHLIGRQRYYRQEFSTLRFLQQLEVDLIRKLKIRQILLLILRVLLILLLILAFARPYRTTQSPGIDVGKGETLYLIVDNSLSMQAQVKGRSLLEQVKSSLLAATEKIEYPVYVKLVKTTLPQHVKDFGLITDPTGIATILSNIAASNRRGSINSARRSGFSAISRIPTLTEHRRWTAISKKPTVGLFFFPSAGSWKMWRLPPCPYPASCSGKIKAPGFVSFYQTGVPEQLRNWSSGTVAAPVSLFIGDQKLGQALLNVPPQGKSYVRFEFIPSSPGRQRARLKIADDDLIMDNQRYFTVNIPDQIAALIVARNPADGRYIKRALMADESSVIKVKMTSPVLFVTEDLTRYDLLIFSNVDELPPNAQTQLRFFIEAGGGLLIFPGKDCAPEKFNSLWAGEYGFPKWRSTRKAGPDQYLKLGNTDATHPVFTGLLRGKESFEYSPEFYTIPGFSAGQNHKILATYEDNTPFIIETALAGGRGLLIAAAPVADWSNLQLTGFFPAVINRMAFYLAQQGMTDPEIFCGDTLLISPAKLNIRNDLWIRTPDNRRIKLALGVADPIMFDDTGLSGFYELYSEGRLLKEYVVNIPESEASAQFLTESDFAELSGDYQGKMGVFFIGAENILNPLEHSRELADWLLAMALIIALLESYIGRINRKTGRKIQNG